MRACYGVRLTKSPRDWGSESQFEAELDDARSAPCSSDLAEITAAQVSGGIPEGRRVGDIVSLCPEFEREAFLQAGHFRDADVDASLTRPDHGVASQRAERDAGTSECVAIQISVQT